LPRLRTAPRVVRRLVSGHYFPLQSCSMVSGEESDRRGQRGNDDKPHACTEKGCSSRFRTSALKVHRTHAAQKEVREQLRSGARRDPQLAGLDTQQQPTHAVRDSPLQQLEQPPSPPPGKSADDQLQPSSSPTGPPDDGSSLVAGNSGDRSALTSGDATAAELGAREETQGGEPVAPGPKTPSGPQPAVPPAPPMQPSPGEPSSTEEEAGDSGVESPKADSNPRPSESSRPIGTNGTRKPGRKSQRCRLCRDQQVLHPSFSILFVSTIRPETHSILTMVMSRNVVLGGIRAIDVRNGAWTTGATRQFRI
jgi:hypothetical protein